MGLFSILGDSISTFQGCNPACNAVYFDERAARANGLEGPGDTWWARVLAHFGAELLVNESFSGSLVTGSGFPAACSVERTGNLARDGLQPDAVLFFIGINDFGYCAPLLGDSSAPAPYNVGFRDCYATMLERVRDKCPEASLVCATHMATTAKGFPAWVYPEDNEAGLSLREYNEAIREIARSQGALVADLAATGLKYETLDGVHPTKDGHETLARAWISELEELGFRPPAQGLPREAGF